MQFGDYNRFEYFHNKKSFFIATNIVLLLQKNIIEMKKHLPNVTDIQLNTQTDKVDQTNSYATLF